MKIQIEKRQIFVDEIEFKSEIKRVCLLQKKVFNHARVGYRTFKKELGLKITELEFMELCFRFGLETYKNCVEIDQCLSDGFLTFSNEHSIENDKQA